MSNPMQQQQDVPRRGDFVVHKERNGPQQLITGLYGDGGVEVESGDFYRKEQLTFGGHFQNDKQVQVSRWKANCGEVFREGVLGSTDGCCAKRKPRK